MLTLDHVQIAIPAGGEEAARAFFGELLGLAEIAKPTALAGRGGCWFALGAIQLHLGVEPGFQPARKAHIALHTADLGNLRACLAAAGHAVREDMSVPDRQRFFSEDPFGNRIEFVQAGRSA